MKFPRPEYWSGQPFPSLGDLPNPGIEPRSPTLQADSLAAEPQGKPENTGVGSLSLLQGIFLSQELNWGFLYCRQILYQLNYQGSPTLYKLDNKDLSYSTENITQYFVILSFLDSSVGKESTCNAGDPGSIPGSGRSPGEGIGYPFQYSSASLVAQLVNNPVWETWV